MKKERRDMSDKELDEFFSRKVQNPDIPFHQADWELMKRKLEHQSFPGNGNIRGKGNSGWLLALFSLILLVGIILVWDNWSRKNETPLGDSMSKGGEVVPREAPAIREPFKNQAGKQEMEIAAGQSKPDEQINPNATSENGLPAKLSPKFNGAIPASSLNKVEVPNNIIREEFPIINGAGVSAKRKSFNGPFAKQLSRVLIYSDGFMDRPSLHENRDAVAAREQEEKNSRLGFNKFSLALSIAPDVSALRIRDIAGLGTSLGLNLEYFFQPNLSLNAGVMYAFKTYKGKGVDYPGYATGLSGMLGDCWMLDFPLNIRYYPINSDLNRWYISAGASSYLMLKEKYDLEVTSSSGKPYERRVEVRNGKRHYFSVVNLSLGYERVLTDKMAIQVEPYLKLPMGGIGEGSIKLKSAGALIGLKYNW